jgi:hypothetical protein
LKATKSILFFYVPNPAVRFNLLCGNIFFLTQKRASAGRFFWPTKKYFSTQKGFHYHQGQWFHFREKMLVNLFGS